jgi:hypothetical protein
MARKKTNVKKVIESDNEKVTISELQSWLNGAIAFQEDDWVPNKAQWDKIITKIRNLVNDVNDEDNLHPQVVQNVQPSQHNVVSQQMYPQQAPPPPQQSPIFQPPPPPQQSPIFQPPQQMVKREVIGNIDGTDVVASGAPAIKKNSLNPIEKNGQLHSRFE